MKERPPKTDIRIMNETEFRQELENIINKDFEKSFDEHIKPIEKLKQFFPHNISLHCKCLELAGVDCFRYVFWKKIPPDQLSMFSKVTVNNRYEAVCREMIRKGLLSLHDDLYDDDKVVVYFNKGKAVHFGKIQNHRFISKWGKSLVWEHGLFEVPLCYGNAVMFSDGVLNMDVLNNVVGTCAKR